jgi:subtilisin family serine protease
MDEFIVLRNLLPGGFAGVEWPPLTMDPSDFLLGSPTQGTPWSHLGVGGYPFDTPPEPQIEVESIDEGERAELLRDPAVVSISPTMRMKLIRPLTDVVKDNAPSDWAMESIGALGTTWDGSGVKVAVLDSGIDANHPAFSGLDITSKDFTDTGIMDVNGHGTHCAGTLFGRDVEGRRIGVARGVTQALIGKVLDDDGYGTTDSLYAGISWALHSGANVISLSMGLDFPGEVRERTDAGWPVELATSRALEAYRANIRLFDSLMAMIRAIEEFTGGALLVAASGNESRGDLDPDFRIAASLPAAAQGVVSVAACAHGPSGLSIAPFSNTMPSITAPGVGIESAQIGGGLISLSGTSQACPHVAGVAALWWQALSQQEWSRASLVRSNLIARARSDRFSEGTRPIDMGVGLVSAP